MLGSRMRQRHVVAMLVALLLTTAAAALFAACGTKKSGTSSAAKGTPMQLKVMEFNIEYGGGLVSLKKTEEAIKLGGADVVGIEESYTNLPRIAKATGHSFYNSSLQILSKYPILEAAQANGLYALIEVQPGYVIAFCNVHLDYVAYGPTALLHKKPLDAILAKEMEVRGHALDQQYSALPALAAQGYPVFLTGDFNEPSSLDYTAAMVGSRPQVTAVVPWPVSTKLLSLGFHDSYRDANPDPVTVPGLTWPAHRPKVASWAGNYTAAQFKSEADRIDYVYTAGASETLTSTIMGEQPALPNTGVTLIVTPWPSDHRAVVSTFEITPVAMPTMIAVNARLLTVGDSVTVTYNAPGKSGLKVVVVTPGGAADVGLIGQDAPGTKGSLTFDTSKLAAGGYEAVLTAGDGSVVSRVPFWLRAKNAKVQLTTDKSTYTVGEPIVVSWKNGPANRWDWIGVYKANAADPNVDYYLNWDYTGGHSSGTIPPQVDGSLTIGSDSQGGPWPLAPGKYVVHYLLTDAYTSAGSTTFTVTK
jgi:endonuclease/exonuclease/phosphatase family metal-dependent hydrolase